MITEVNRIRAVIVDDEPLGRTVIREMLRGDADIEIIGECANGHEAVELISQAQPDLLFLDVQMPEVDGFEVLSALDELPLVIFVTAYDQYAVRAFEVHAVDYLLKPFDRDRFSKAVQRVKAQLKQARNDAVNERILALLEEQKARTREDYSEERWLGIGDFRGRIVVVAFTTPTPTLTRIISVRKALKAERKYYEKTLKDELGLT